MEWKFVKKEKERKKKKKTPQIQKIGRNKSNFSKFIQVNENNLTLKAMKWKFGGKKKRKEKVENFTLDP